MCDALRTMDLYFVSLVAIAALIPLLPVVMFVLSLVAFALAPYPPARASQNLLQAWKLLGIALLPVPILVLLEFGAYTTCGSDRFVGSGLDAAFFGVVATLALGTPWVLRRWFRRIAPTRAVGVLFTAVAACAGACLVAIDVVVRVGRGFHDF